MSEENTEIVAVPETVALGVLQVEPKDIIHRASAIATELAKVITDRSLFTTISGKKYVTVEGWNTLGAMMGVLPVEKETHVIPGGFEASVDLIRTSDGLKIGGASAICTVDEKKWADRDPYAVRSMAITRATGKAFRLGFSWIMKLAGYEATPAEEIVEGDVRPAPKDKSNSVRPYTPEKLKERVDANRAEMKALVVDGGTKVTENMRQVLAAVLGKVFEADADRYALCVWLVGEASTKKMPADAVLALSKWLGATTFEAVPNEMAVREAMSALPEALKAQGQQELPEAK